MRYLRLNKSPRWWAATVAGCILTALLARAENPVLRIERVPVFAGYADFLAMPDGKLVVSSQEECDCPAQISVLDEKGSLIQVVILKESVWPIKPPVLLADGSFLGSFAISPTVEQVMRLPPDGSAVTGVPILSNAQTVLPFPGGKALVYGRFGMQSGLVGSPFSIYEIEPGSNGTRLQAQPLQFSPADLGTRPRDVAVTTTGHVWAFLVPREATDGTFGTLARFLPDGRRDPAFNPPAPIIDRGYWNETSDWMRPTQGEAVYIFQSDWQFQRYTSTGQPDRSFVPDWPASPDIVLAPLAVTPEGGVIVPVGWYSTLQKLRPDGKIDPSFTSELRDLGRGAAFSVKAEANGTEGLLWIRHQGFRGGVSAFRDRIQRLLPDGRVDRSFSDTQLGRTRVEGVRVTAEISGSVQAWQVQGNESFGSSADWGDVLGGVVWSTIEISPVATSPRKIVVYEAPLRDGLQGRLSSLFFRIVPAAP